MNATSPSKVRPPRGRGAKRRIGLPAARTDWSQCDPANLEHPSLYINRELSWLEFNQRVLNQALDGAHPLLERVKFLAIVREGTADEFLAEVTPAVAHLAAATHSAPNMALLELSLPGVNKAVTLAEYAASLGVASADVVAFGDMPNDIEMLRWAGRGVAMGQAVEVVREAADHVTGTVYDDGVALELARWFP